MKLFNSKRGEISLNEIIWRVGKIIFTILILTSVWIWANNQATGEDLDKKYLAKDIGLMANTLQHLPGEVEVYYQPKVSPLENYEVTVRNSWVTVNTPDIKDRRYHRYFQDSEMTDFDFNSQKDAGLVFIKKGSSTAIGTDKADITDINPCIKPTPHAPVQSLLLNPSYVGDFPGRTNPTFVDSSGNYEMIEEKVTADIISAAIAQSQMSGISFAETRASGTPLPEEDDLIAMTGNKGAVITLVLGSNQNDYINDVTVTFKPSSKESQYLACLIAHQLETDFDSVTSVSTLASQDILLLTSASPAVTIHLGNMNLNTNPLLDSKNRINLKKSIFDAVGEYYQERVLS